MKTVFCTIPMRNDLEKGTYKVYGNSKIANNREVIFPINAVLEKILKENERVKVILLAKQDINNNYLNNIKLYKQELTDINSAIRADILYEVITIPFNEGAPFVHTDALKKIIDVLDKDCEIYCDITYGPKSTPILIMNVLNFAEKFLNCEIKDIVYGQADFIKNDDGKTVAQNRVLCNLGVLYNIDAITNTLQCKSADEAKKILNILLDI